MYLFPKFQTILSRRIKEGEWKPCYPQPQKRMEKNVQMSTQACSLEKRTAGVPPALQTLRTFQLTFFEYWKKWFQALESPSLSNIQTCLLFLSFKENPQDLPSGFD